MRNILFLCTGNSARSIMAEAYMSAAGQGRWRAYSAGSKPVGAPNPFALKTLSANAVDVGEGENAPRSKSWDEFAAPGAPVMDVVVTVCDNAAGESCPVWPTRNGASPRRLHWSFEDPAAAQGDDGAVAAEFARVFSEIKSKIDGFLAEES